MSNETDQEIRKSAQLSQVRNEEEYVITDDSDTSNILRVYLNNFMILNLEIQSKGENS